MKPDPFILGDRPQEIDCFQELAIQFYPWNSIYLPLFEITASEKESSFLTHHTVILGNTFETVKQK